MKCFRAILAVLVATLVLTTSVSAHHKPGHDGGPPNKSDSQSNKSEKHANGENSPHGQGLQLGRLVRDLSGNESEALEDELDDCTTVDDLKDMRLGQIKRLSHAAGLSTQDLKDVLDSDDGSHAGLGRLIRDGLESDEANDLQDKLRDGLESDDLQKLSVGKLLQAMRACGVTPAEVAELIREH
jgi:hypothetical protein